MKPLSKGDTCRVRLHTGEVVEAVYDVPFDNKKRHWVYIKDCGHFIAGKFKPDADTRVRFVGPACVLVPVGVSV